MTFWATLLGGEIQERFVHSYIEALLVRQSTIMVHIAEIQSSPGIYTPDDVERRQFAANNHHVC
jgi:hypothetical protein